MRVSGAMRLKLDGHRTFERWLMSNDTAAQLDHRRRKRSIGRRLHEDPQFDVFS